MPSSDGGDDFVWIGSRCEGFWLCVGFGEEAVDGGLEVDDGSEDAAFQATPGQLGAEAFDGIEPGGQGRREVEDEARMPVEPSADLGMLAGGVIVEDDVDHLAGRYVGFDRVEEADELLMAAAACCGR